jgi:hypothetical protein
VDSIFMMPHLGVLSKVHEQSATEVFNKDCLVMLGHCIAPLGEGKEGVNVVKVKIEADGGTSEKTLKYGDLELVSIPQDKKTKVIVHPEKGFDVGNGKGKPVDVTLTGGAVGLVIDARGRPFTLPDDKKKRIDSLKKWFKAVGMYPDG